MQSLFFLLSWALVSAPPAGAGPAAPPARPGQEAELMQLFDFGEPDPAAAWRPVHDGVMGGLSSGRAEPVEGAVQFAGRVSLENNGGFASFRVGVEMPDLSRYDGLRLRARGDGQVYKLSVRTDGGWDGVSWQAPFATVADTWTVVDLDFEDLVPTWRGRLVPDAGVFDPTSIRQLGILVADKQEGAFSLELASIDARRSESSDRGAGTRAAARSRSTALAAILDDGGDARALLGALSWKERLVVVAAPSDLDAVASRQVGHLLARGDELAARELRVGILMGSRGGRLAGRTLSPAAVADLRDAWDLPARDWSVALVGKDGGVKVRWRSIVDPDAVFAIVDAMPMRQREIAERASVAD